MLYQKERSGNPGSLPGNGRDAEETEFPFFLPLFSRHLSSGHVRAIETCLPATHDGAQDDRQGDQIGRFFAGWPIVFFGQFFIIFEVIQHFWDYFLPGANPTAFEFTATTPAL
jgi:hypothetical protein